MFRKIRSGFSTLGFLWSRRRIVWNIITHTDEIRRLKYEKQQCEDCGGEVEDMCETHMEELGNIGGVDLKSDFK